MLQKQIVLRLVWTANDEQSARISEIRRDSLLTVCKGHINHAKRKSLEGKKKIYIIPLFGIREAKV